MRLRLKVDLPQKRWLHYSFNRLWSKTSTKMTKICSWLMKCHLRKRRASLKMLHSLENWECLTSIPTKVIMQHILMTEVRRICPTSKLSISKTISSKMKFKFQNKMAMASQLSSLWSSFRMLISCHQPNNSNWTNFSNKNGRKILSHKKSSNITIFTRYWQRMLQKQNNVSPIWIQMTSQKK